MKNQNFLLIQNEKKNTISKPFPFPSQRILRLNIVFSFCFLLCYLAQTSVIFLIFLINSSVNAPFSFSTSSYRQV